VACLPALGKDDYKSAACSDRKVRLAGDTALVTGRAAIEAENPLLARLGFLGHLRRLRATTRNCKGGIGMHHQSKITRRRALQMAGAVGTASASNLGGAESFGGLHRREASHLPLA
jgi:hypothetical protein